MHKKKFSDEQQELVALLPQGLPKMTDGAKLVLANIILLYGTEFAKNNGYVYRSTDDMLKDTEISSKTTLARANRQLSQLGLMAMNSGSYESRKANEYRLSDELLDKIGFKPNETMGTLMGTLSADMGTLSSGFMGTLSADMGTLSVNEVMMQLVEQNKSLTLMVSELSKQVKSLTEQVESITKNSKCTTETDTEIEKEKKDLVTKGTSTCEKDEVISTEGTGASAFDTSATVTVISTETDKASAYGVSSSLIEEELASAFEPISTDTSTEDTRNDSTVVASTSSNEDLTTADRLTLLQPLEESTPPSSAAPPLTEDFVKHVKAEIRNGVYQWSLNLTDVPDYITGDDYNPIVVEAIKAQPDYNDYLGNINLSELDEFARELMENRLHNKDIPKIVRQNQYKIRHEQHRNELMGDCVRMGSNSMIATGSAQMACA